MTHFCVRRQLSSADEGTNFKTSEGWKWAFCKRHGIRKLSFQGEKLSAASDQFVPRFKALTEKSLSHNQVFNRDETGLNYGLCRNLLLHQVSKSLLMEEK